MRNLTEEEYNIIYDAYINNHRGLVYCASLIKTSTKKVKEELIKRGVHIRNKTEATIFSNKNRALKKDEDYFKKQS